MKKNTTTEFAPAERKPIEIVKSQSQVLMKDSNIRAIMEAMPHIVTVLNSNRQIIYANQIFLDYLKLENMEELIGVRPGEALNCINAGKTDGGCGTSEFCSTCGAVDVILSGLDGTETAKECNISTVHGEAMEFMVWGKPLNINGETFLAFTVEDIRHEKRRHALERIFFHDVLNTAGGIRGCAEIINRGSLEENSKKELTRDIEFLADRLIDEIMAQQQLLAAEKKELDVSPYPLKPLELLESITKAYANHETGKNKIISIDKKLSTDASIVTDSNILYRVLSNMVKNALEAVSPGDEIRLSAIKKDGHIKFRVHNKGTMSRDVQMQLFQRSFSTKGKGRGLGTYSMKLLTTRYLKGDISFSSSEEEGTTFEAKLPILLETDT